MGFLNYLWRFSQRGLRSSALCTRWGRRGEDHIVCFFINFAEYPLGEYTLSTRPYILYLEWETNLLRFEIGFLNLS